MSHAAEDEIPAVPEIASNAGSLNSDTGAGSGVDVSRDGEPTDGVAADLSDGNQSDANQSGQSAPWPGGYVIQLGQPQRETWDSEIIDDPNSLRLMEELISDGGSGFEVAGPWQFTSLDPSEQEKADLFQLHGLKPSDF